MAECDFQSSLPLWVHQQPKGTSLPILFPHTGGLQSEDVPRTAPPNVTLNSPKVFPEASHLPAVLPAVTSLCPCRRSRAVKHPNAFAGPDGGPEIGAVGQLGQADPGAHADAGAVRRQAAEEGCGGNCRTEASACPDRAVLHYPWQRQGRGNGDVGWMQTFGTLWHWGWSSSSLWGTIGAMPRCPHAALAPRSTPPSHLSIPRLHPTPLLSSRGPAQTRASSSRSWPRGTTRRSRQSTRRTSRVRRGRERGEHRGARTAPSPQTRPVTWWAVDPQPGCRAQLSPLSAAYHKRLEDDLSSDTSGHFKRILVSLALVPGGVSRWGWSPLCCRMGFGTWFGEDRARERCAAVVLGTSQMSSPRCLYPTTGQPR